MARGNVSARRLAAGLIIAAACVLASSAAADDELPPTGQRAQTLDTDHLPSGELKYLLFLPQGYGKSQQKWPLILFLHGAGESGEDLEKVKVHGPPKIVESKPDFPFIVVSPQSPKFGWNRPALVELLDEVIARYDVDEDRVYLTGLSMGGFGSWALASEHPERFAAVVPICGGGKIEMTETLKNIPIWAFHGAKDTVVVLNQSERMVEALKKIGGNVKLTVYPEAGHDSWTETYDNPELYEWLLGQRRK